MRLLRNTISVAGFVLTLLACISANGQDKKLTLSLQDYEDRVQGIWTAQILGALMGFPFEHKVSSAAWIDTLSLKTNHAPVDDDWYYEIVAIRAFEKYGVNMSVGQLVRQWLDNSAGSWGSSEQARILMSRGILPPDCGHPRYNKLWHSIGPQFSCDVYGALAPGMPNLAGKLARTYGRINGYAEGLDGGVFIATMISLGFSETDPKVIVRKAAKIINPSSPYRQCIDLVIQLAEKGKSPVEVFNAVEDRWHIEYPATNNAVPNGGIVAASVWFGEGDFLKTINLAFSAADFTDADCNAANAAAVVGAMHGMKALPAHLVKLLNDSIVGDKMGKVMLTPAVNESISVLAKRTSAVGMKILKENGARFKENNLEILVAEPLAQAAENMTLSDLTKYWNIDWTLERAGFGGAGGGMQGIRGITFLDNDVLATYPRDEVRAVVISRILNIQNKKIFSFEAGVDSQRVWRCEVYINNEKILNQLIEGEVQGQKWHPIKIDLSPFKDRTVKIRVYQRVLIPGRASGNAYWKNFKIE